MNQLDTVPTGFCDEMVTHDQTDMTSLFSECVIAMSFVCLTAVDVPVLALVVQSSIALFLQSGLSVSPIYRGPTPGFDYV